MKNHYFSFVLFILFSTAIFAQDATYKIEFISNWSSATHPADFPSTAHWSPLIGTTHTNTAQFLQSGLIASPGVEQVAETGLTSIITTEINALIVGGLAYKIINGPGLSSVLLGLGTITVSNVEVVHSFPYISLLTMIAPSPDWIAQINNLKLTDTNDNWLASVSVDVYATDAGTDSGTTYNSPNDDTDPADNISSLQNTLPFSDQIIGTFVFTLEQVLSVSTNELEHSIAIYPNPNQGRIFINNSGNNILKKAIVYTTNGRKVKEFTLIANQNSLNVNTLTSGLYFLKLNSENGTITKKLIIQ
jgi:hypothetical protein